MICTCDQGRPCPLASLEPRQARTPEEQCPARYRHPGGDTKLACQYAAGHLSKHKAYDGTEWGQKTPPMVAGAPASPRKTWGDVALGVLIVAAVGAVVWWHRGEKARSFF